MFSRSLIIGCAALIGGAVPARAAVLITVDKSVQQMTVAVDGVPRWIFPVSTGLPKYDTPSGSFKAFRMEAEHFSKEWDDAPMPHSIFFTKVGHAIHGSLETRRMGNPASHGCVRLSPANAAKLFELVKQQGVLNTTVVLTGDVRIAMARAGTRTAAAAPRPDVQAEDFAQGYGYREAYGNRESYGYRRYDDDPRYQQYQPYQSYQPYQAYPAYRRFPF
jgi:hypothetical protein